MSEVQTERHWGYYATMMRLSELLRALEDHGGSLDPQEHAMVWIDCPDEGCYVRTRHIVRIEAYFRGKSEVWSRVIVSEPAGSASTLIDKRRPKLVHDAVARAELRAAEVLLDALRTRFV